MHLTVSIHLMLQFIIIYPQRLNRGFCFNTSHVVVYPFSLFLFNKSKEFQYISCCSLSISDCINDNDRNVSIHLMLQFIKKKYFSFINQILVSIHLMLQFIVQYSLPIQSQESFNTSHVVVYLINSDIIVLFACCFNTSHVVVYQLCYQK